MDGPGCRTRTNLREVEEDWSATRIDMRDEAGRDAENPSGRRGVRHALAVQDSAVLCRSDHGERVALSNAIPARRTSSWSGIQSPAVTTVSQATVDRAPVSRCSRTTDSTRSLP